MKPEQFCYWLQGHFELNKDQDTLTPEQIQTIKNHLNLVFLHTLDPIANSQTTTPPSDLNQAHNGSDGTTYRC